MVLVGTAVNAETPTNCILAVASAPNDLLPMGNAVGIGISDLVTHPQQQPKFGGTGDGSNATG